MPHDEPASDATRCARAPEPPRSISEPLAPPIQLASVYRIAGLDEVDALFEGRAEGFFYARDGHPNAAQLADKLAKLEGAEAGLICASGMGAIAASVLTLTEQGGRVLVSEGLYGKTTTLIARELARFGVSHTLFDPSRPETLRRALAEAPDARLVVAETISNPLLRVCDLEGVAAAARDAGVPLMIDHTFAPLLCKPIALGTTLVAHSLTKLIGGHGDVTLGAVVGPRDLIARIHAVASTFGQTGNPFDCWLTIRGAVTLPLRVERTSRTALELARRLETHPKVERTMYPGLVSHPDHALAKRLFSGGFGAMIAFDVGGREQADRLIRGLRAIPFAPSLGDAQTTVSHPCSTSHRGQDPAVLERLGVTPGLIRLSVGLEDVEDLWNDFAQALEFA
ncbi:trans-sulfuration enzyme family protein [Paludisphaera mucosa]|uniref:Aminotransferase class I/II-fold pyridoxal phosphate-dependent enzyme n=1 Tax=Paludisphaera mucosa TaxID=3030827 RepID=A0ABT6FC33_9BACT|nr:aminotransferase class I/II-fold pyridoxal phosphate-dependent enzyme [Paludisphaera mucosa]MDG3005148.1 aminotransferase class I/II-fold pyridoxal phosphate-dependent enzyme [Paludisphaera mucosa]